MNKDYQQVRKDLVDFEERYGYAPASIEALDRKFPNYQKAKNKKAKNRQAKQSRKKNRK